MKNTIRLGILFAVALMLNTHDAGAAKVQGREGMLPLGTKAPDFQLKDVVTGKQVSRDDFVGRKVLAVLFICRHCPYVQHVKQGLAKLGRDYAPGGVSGAASASGSHAGKDVAIVAISSNDPAAYPEDSPASLKEMALQEGFAFPFLFDETQGVARAYTAVCTPDCFVFDQGRRLVYRGQFDDSRPGKKEPVTGRDVRAAIEAVLAGRPVSPDQKPAVGCSIKWRKE